MSKTDWHLSILKTWHEILSLEAYHSTFFLWEGEEYPNIYSNECNSCRITINQSHNANGIVTHISWYNQICAKAYCPNPTELQPFTSNSQRNSYKYWRFFQGSIVYCTALDWSATRSSTLQEDLQLLDRKHVSANIKN